MMSNGQVQLIFYFSVVFLPLLLFAMAVSYIKEAASLMKNSVLFIILVILFAGTYLVQEYLPQQNEVKKQYLSQAIDLKDF